MHYFSYYAGDYCMQIVRKGSIVECMDNAILLAEREKKPISKFVLSLTEYQDLLAVTKKMVKEYKGIPVEYRE
jgi:hypothetical protein